MSSCNDLNLNPLSEGSSENWYSNESEITMALNDLYRIDFWPNYLIPYGDYDLWTDDMMNRDRTTPFVNGTLNGQDGTINGWWTNSYKCIARANTIIANLEKGTGTVKFIPLNDIPKIKYELEKLKQEIDATGEVYKVMKVLLELAKISEMYEQSLIELIDEAVIPKISSSTNPKLIVIISLVLGLFMGIFITFVKEFAKGIDWKEFKN